MDFFGFQTNDEIILDLARRVANVRKRRKISQQQLANMSGVSYGSIKRFENTGHISLFSLTRIANSLDCVDEIKNLFTRVEYKSIDEVFYEE